MFDHAGKVIIGALAVGGGFLVGNLLTLLACRVLAKFALKQRLNETLEKALRVIGGIAVAVLVAFLVFRGGSGWGFGGGGSGEGSGADGTGEGKAAEQRPEGPPAGPPKAIGSVTVQVTELTVIVLPAKEYPRTFKFLGERDGRELAAAKARLKELQDASDGRLRLLNLNVYKDSTAADHPDVVAFEDHAHALGINTNPKKMDRPYAE
jgi:hypothetical protein